MTRYLIALIGHRNYITLLLSSTLTGCLRFQFLEEIEDVCRDMWSSHKLYKHIDRWVDEYITGWLCGCQLVWVKWKWTEWYMHGWYTLLCSALHYTRILSTDRGRQTDIDRLFTVMHKDIQANFMALYSLTMRVTLEILYLSLWITFLVINILLVRSLYENP